ncbi:MAG TPA: VanZ family protein [Candidatus Cloacimonadota bacterium]|nr:VanZ family protein [Candidatus Cloacimonadota bacterium]
MNKKGYLYLSLLWMLLIWLVSSIPSKDLPSVNLWSSDKLAHILVYLIWGLLVSTYLRKRNVGTQVYLGIFVLMWISAALDEYHQSYIPGRSVSVYDFFANSLGLLSALFTGLYKKKKHQA